MKAPKLAHKPESKTPTAIPAEYETNSVEHKYGGNGWAVVQVLESEYCRLARFFQDKEGRWKIESQVFLAWTKLLSLEPERVFDKGKMLWVDTGAFLKLPQELMDTIKKIRDSIASGEYVVKNTRIVKANL